MSESVYIYAKANSAEVVGQLVRAIAADTRPEFPDDEPWLDDALFEAIDCIPSPDSVEALDDVDVILFFERDADTVLRSFGALADAFALISAVAMYSIGDGSVVFGRADSPGMVDVLSFELDEDDQFVVCEAASGIPRVVADGTAARANRSLTKALVWFGRNYPA